MAAVWVLARRRLALNWRGLVASGLLLGLGFGLCLVSIAAARKTTSAYDRILIAADAPDAAVAHGSAPDLAERSLRTIDGITRQRVYAGFLGVADGVDPALTSGLLVSTGDDFPLELPVLGSGRLPNPGAANEVFVNDAVADGADLDLGDRLTFRLFTPGSSAAIPATVTVVGIGTLPVEAVSDETRTSGIVVFTRAFYDAHRDLTAYSVSNVDLAPGFDARDDLAGAVDVLGHKLQSARSQETDAIREALRPLIIVVAALGVLAFGATTVAAWQVVQRNRERASANVATLRAMGVARSQLRLIDVITSAAVAVVAIGTALLTMLAVSPVGPVGPLHDLDPSQGFSIDMTTAAVGGAAILFTVVVFTLAMSSARQLGNTRSLVRSQAFANVGLGPSAAAGLTLAFRTSNGADRVWRHVAATTLVTGVLALCATFVPSAVDLTATPSRYGFDADLVAVNAYGDQPAAALAVAFGGTDRVLAATGYTSAPFMLDGRAVPGLAATAVKGDLTPTILQGRPARTDRELVVGRDTLDSIGATVGDIVSVHISAPPSTGRPGVNTPIELRIVGIATFPPVNQFGTDVPRLGVGALVTREAFLRMGGDPMNEPEFTMMRLADDADPAAVIARVPDGFYDGAHTTTTWFTGTLPAEIRQLDAAMPYLQTSLLVAYAMLLAVATHAQWTLARTNRHAVAVLRAVGCTGRQLRAITAWQAVPSALAATLVGIPVGIALGRRAFTFFARSLAVVDTPTTTGMSIGVLVAAVLGAIVLANLLSMILAPPSRAAFVQRRG
jgi:putative ABC transport system permease protein